MPQLSTTAHEGCATTSIGSAAAEPASCCGVSPKLRHRLPLRPGRRILFALLPLLFLLGIGEVCARSWLYYVADPASYAQYAVPEEFPTAAKYRPHHYLCYMLQPNYRRGKTIHNSLGFRGPEIVARKRAGTTRIAILGGSTTYCEFIDDNAMTFPAQLERELRNQGYSVEVINAGCPGYNSWESLINLQLRVIDLAPDVVILYEGVNDVHTRLVRPDAYTGDNSGRRTVWRTPIEVTICQHSCLSRIVGHHLGVWRLPGVDSYVQAPTADPGCHTYSHALGTLPEVALRANPPHFLARNLRSMIGVCRQNGATPMLATWPHSNECGDYAATPHYEQGFWENNEVVRATASEAKAPLFDLATLMPKNRYYWRDGRHVNEAGATLQAALFAEFLMESGLLSGHELAADPNGPTSQR